MKSRKVRKPKGTTVVINTSMPPGGFVPGQSYSIDFRNNPASVSGGDKPSVEKQKFQFEPKENKR